MKSILALVAVVLSLGLQTPAHAETVLRFGHFPNVTHVQALVAHHLSRQGKGWFEERLGPDVKIEWFVYNAGPSAMEAIFANSIDLTFVGPSPAINAYSKANGKEVRIISGAVNGGSALVVQGDSNLKTGEDFRGKTIATPQLGNTQDVSCRAWLTEHGLKITQLGGDARVIPTANPEQLSLFASKKIDAVWTVEPWVSRLEREAGGKVLVDEKDSVTTVLVASVRAMREKRELLKKIVQAQKELTEWIQANPDQAKAMVVAELGELTKTRVSPDLIAAAWPRIHLTTEVSMDNLKTFVSNAEKAGFLKRAPDLGQLVEAP